MRLEAAIRQTLERSKVDDPQSRAVIVDPHAVSSLRPGRPYGGAHPDRDLEPRRTWRRHLPASSTFISSNEAFHLKELTQAHPDPGGGYHRVEFAGIFSGLGSR